MRSVGSDVAEPLSLSAGLPLCLFVPSECDTGEETIYRCRGASEGEIESRSGCGAVVSFKEYRALKAAATGTSTAASKTTSSTPSAASRTPAKLHPAPTRRPLSSLHSNALHSRTPLHGRANAAAVAQTSPAPSAASPASAGPVSTPPSSTPKSTPQPPPTSTAADTDSDSSDDLGGDDDPPSSGTGARARRPPVVTSTSTTPTKLPRSGASSPVHDDGGSSGPAALGSAARMRALRLKLAKQREKSLEEFRDKYGAEGDEETEEEQAAAVRKRTGEASDDFLSCSQEEGAIARAPMVASLSIKGAENPLAGGHRRAFTLPRAHGAMSTSAKALIAERQKTIHTGRRLGARLRISSGAFTTFKPLEAPPVVEEDEGELAPPPPPKVEETKTTPDGFQPLVIWQPTPEELVANPKLTTIEVPMLVCKWLRPHQREGVKFMCECVLGQRNLGPSEEKTTPPPPSTTDADGNTCTPATQTALTSMGGGAILAGQNLRTCASTSSHTCIFANSLANSFIRVSPFPFLLPLHRRHGSRQDASECGPGVYSVDARFRGRLAGRAQGDHRHTDVSREQLEQRARQVAREGSRQHCRVVGGRQGQHLVRHRHLRRTRFEDARTHHQLRLLQTKRRSTQQTRTL